MYPQEVIGLWDSSPYDYGAMESSELALLPDGRGWSRWSNAAGGLSIRRLRWSSTEPGVMTLRYVLLLSGEWKFDEDRRESVSIESQYHENELVTVQYHLLSDITPLRAEPFTALHLSEAVEFCHTFGLHHRQPTIKDDPTHGLIPSLDE